jgi:signal transduction histidine kinase
MEKFATKFKNIKLIMYIILSVGIVLFEEITTSRIYLFIGVILVFLLIESWKESLSQEKTRIIILIVQLLLILFLEYQSRYAMNYFIHSLYIILILESAMNFQGKKSIILGVLILVVASFKYIYIISIKMSIGSIAQYAFFLTLNVSIMVTLNLLKKVIEAKKAQEKLQASLNEAIAQEERNRISREIHDTLGHQMVNMIMQLEIININRDLDKIPKVIQDARRTHKILRNIVEDNYNAVEEDTSINSLLDVYEEKTGINITKEIDQTFYYPKTVYRIIREGLTNAAKYSEASSITIKLSVDDEYIHFFIKDNGIGCVQIKENLGLKGIKKSVELFDGEVIFSGKSGFLIKGYIRRIKND